MSISFLSPVVQDLIFSFSDVEKREREVVDL